MESQESRQRRLDDFTQSFSRQLVFYTCPIVISLSMSNLAMTLAISVCAASVFLIMLPQIPNIAKAYSCNSSSSGVSTSLSGYTGSCSTSSSSTRAVTGVSSAKCALTSPNCSLAVGLGSSSSATTGGGSRANCSFTPSHHGECIQPGTGGGSGASCSVTASNREISDSFSQSGSGKCP